MFPAINLEKVYEFEYMVVLTIDQEINVEL